MPTFKVGIAMKKNSSPRSLSMKARILATIRSIPKGKVSTYGAVARGAGYPRGVRQVVAALRGAVGVPWHRVLGAGGQIKIPGEYGLEQRFRLESEGVRFRGKRVIMKEFEHQFKRKASRP